MNVPKNKVIVSPIGVDPFHFSGDFTASPLKQHHHLSGACVLGWVGSFRKFHGLTTVVQAFAKVRRQQNNVKLMLIGDGAEREVLEAMCEELQIQDSVIFTGKLPYAKIPEYMSLFDIAIVSAGDKDNFHYSPMKLREYMAAGLPCLAPALGEIERNFKDGVHVKLFEAGNVESIFENIGILIKDEALRNTLIQKGKQYVVENFTWDVEVKKVLERLGR